MRWVGVAFLSAALALGLFAQPAAAAADHLFFSINPVASIPSGTLFNVQVQARDSGGGNSVDPSFTGNITIDAAAVGGSDFTAGNVQAAVAGVANFNVFLNNAANTYQITASATGLTSALSSTFNVTADHLAFPAAIANVQSGTSFGTTVEARDANNNVAENFSGTVNLNAAAAGGSNFNGGTSSVAGVAGTATFASLVLNNAADNYTATASSTGLTGAVSNSFNVTADHLTFVTVPASTRSGVAFTIVVQARDANNALAENFTSNVSLNAAAVGGSNFAGGTVTVAASGGVATFNTLVLNNAANDYSAAASSSGVTGANSATFDVFAHHLTITSVVANMQAGTSFGLSVEARDGNNNIAENFNGTVSVNAAAVGGSNLNGGTQSQSALAGSASFSGLALNNAADGYTVTASSPGPANGVSNAFNVTGTQLEVLAVNSVRAGDLFNVTVRALDANGAVAENFTGNVSLNAAATGGSNFVGGTANVAAAAGIASFNGLVLNNAADGYTLTGTSAGLASGVSNAVSVTARNLTVITVIANVRAGTTFSAAVEARDANNAVAENFIGNVSLDAAAVVGGSNFNGGSQSQTALAGRATFTGLALNDAANNYSLTASSAGLISGMSNSFNVTATHLAVLAVSNVRSGDAFNGTVEARDANNNRAENFTGNVSLDAAATGGSNFVGGTANVAASAGSASFVGLVLNNAADGYTATATSAGLTSGVSNSFNVTARQLVITTVVANVEAGTPFSVSVEARDGNNAVAENFNSSVAFNAAAFGGANFQGGTQFATATTGVATVNGLVLEDDADNYTITASSAGLINGPSNSFNVTPARPRISINDVSVTEGNAGTTSATFTVTLSRTAPGVVTVAYATAGVSATSGADFIARADTLTYAPGMTSQTVTITVNGDLLNEIDETFVVDLSGAVGGIVDDPQGVGTIVNDDPLPSLSVVSVSVGEGTSVPVSVTVAVRLSAPSGRTVSVNFSTADGTAVDGVGEPSADYSAMSGSLVFAPGSTEQAFTVSIASDLIGEADEQFFVDLAGAVNAAVSGPRGTVTIVDDDSPEQQLTNLRVQVVLLGLPHGKENTLLNKARLDCKSLKSFANDVLNQAGKTIELADAIDLLDAVDRLMADLGCPPRR